MTTHATIRRTSPSAVRLLWVATISLLVACAGPVVEEEREDSASYLELVEEVPPLPSNGAAALAPQTSVFRPQLVRSGRAEIEVTDIRTSLAAAESLATAVDGFVVGSDFRDGREGARTASLILRLPSDSFRGVLERLPELGRVRSVSSSAEDVSRSYLDIETRLTVGDETVARLRTLASRTGDLQQMLAAERELARAVGELESLKGQLRSYDLRVAESDLWITLVEPGAVVAPDVFRPVTEALRDATETFVQSLAGVIHATVFLAPWLVIVGLLWLAFGRRLRRTRARRRTSAA